MKLTLTLLTVLLLPSFGALHAAEFYVAPNGNDAHPGTKAEPFATLERARDAVRHINRDMQEDMVVVLRGGTYRLNDTLVFEPEDSGTGGHNVIYRAHADETPIFSGGRPVIGWQQDEKGRWKAPAPFDDFRQLYVNGIRATLRSGRDAGGTDTVGRRRLHDHGGHHGRLETSRRRGVLLRLRVGPHAVQSAGHSGEGGNAVITMRQPQFTYAKTKEGVNIASHVDEVYIENSLELLDEPGEWYLDRAARMVYYLPKPGEDMTEVPVVAPCSSDS